MSESTCVPVLAGQTLKLEPRQAGRAEGSRKTSSSSKSSPEGCQGEERGTPRWLWRDQVVVVGAALG